MKREILDTTGFDARYFVNEVCNYLRWYGNAKIHHSHNRYFISKPGCGFWGVSLGRWEPHEAAALISEARAIVRDERC